MAGTGEDVVLSVEETNRWAKGRGGAVLDLLQRLWLGLAPHDAPTALS
jgi:hypothetical protein